MSSSEGFLFAGAGGKVGISADFALAQTVAKSSQLVSGVFMSSSRERLQLMRQERGRDQNWLPVGDGGAVVSPTAFLDELVETCPLLIVASGHEQPIMYASPAFGILSGYSLAELSGRDWRHIFETRTDRPGLWNIGANFGGLSIQGTLRARHKSGATLWLSVRTAPQRDDRGCVTRQIVILHDVTAEHRMRDTLEYRAHYDHLTGIANRHLLCDRFEQAAAYAQRHESRFTVAIIDLDGFKRINDRFGHDVGDALLRCVADRLKETVRGEDTVARLGGDEFCLLLGQEMGHHAMHGALNRITASLMQPVQLGTELIPLSYSVGSSQYPDDGRSLEELLKAADLGLYSMKAVRPQLISPH